MGGGWGGVGVQIVKHSLKQNVFIYMPLRLRAPTCEHILPPRGHLPGRRLVFVCIYMYLHIHTYVTTYIHTNVHIYMGLSPGCAQDPPRYQHGFPIKLSLSLSLSPSLSVSLWGASGTLNPAACARTVRRI